MRPGNGHGGAEFAGADVEQAFDAAIAIAFHRARGTETSVIGICGRRVERVDRRSETVTLEHTQMRCRNARSRDVKKIVFSNDVRLQATTHQRLRCERRPCSRRAAWLGTVRD